MDPIVDLPPNPGTKDSLEKLLRKMIELGGSDLFIQGSSPIRCRVGSQLVALTQRKITDKTAFDFAGLIYGDQAKSRLGAGDRIDASFDIKDIEETPTGTAVTLHRWRVNMISCQRNARQSATITMRAISGTPPSVDKFGIPADIVDTIVNTQGGGLGLIVGPTGSGKTTTMAACLREKLTAPESHRNLVTIEQPIEYLYDQLEMGSSICTQLEVGRNIASFDDGLENAMRMAPTDILLGESRSYETISAAIQGSMSGHFVLSTLHANSCAETLQRIKMLYPPELQHSAIPEALQALKLLVTQRLIPRKDGGNIAIYEYLILDHEERVRLLDAQNPILAAFQLVETNGRPLIADIERHYEAGEISEHEYVRQKLNYQRAKEAAS